MANENIDTYGVDISKEGIEYTEKLLSDHNLKANLKVAGVEKLPYKDNFFDGIISFGVLYYCTYDEIKSAVNEIHRVLKPNAKAFIVVRDIRDYRYGKGIEIEKNTFLIQENDETKCAFNENGMKIHFFTKHEVEELFEDFSELSLDEIIETHDNGAYMDSNFLITVKK